MMPQNQKLKNLKRLIETSSIQQHKNQVRSTDHKTVEEIINKLNEEAKIESMQLQFTQSCFDNFKLFIKLEASDDLQQQAKECITLAAKKEWGDDTTIELDMERMQVIVRNGSAGKILI